MPQHASAAERVSTVKKLELVSQAFTLPDIPQLRHVPKRIDSEDEAELRWFFGDPHVASVAQSAGAFGGQLEIASAYGFGGIPCVKCGGRYRARRRGGKKSVVEWREGTGLTPKPRFGQVISYSVALAQYRKKMRKDLGIVTMSKPEPREGIDPDSAWIAIEKAFRLQGKRAMTEQAFRQMFEVLPETECIPCKACGGIGVVPRRAAAHVEITVYPTGSSKQGVGNSEAVETIRQRINWAGVLVDGAVVVNLRELERYQSVRRIVADMAAMSWTAAESIEEYYSGDNGQRSLEQLVGDRHGLTGSARMRAAAQLRDYQCCVYNLCAYGAQ